MLRCNYVSNKQTDCAQKNKHLAVFFNSCIRTQKRSREVAKSRESVRRFKVYVDYKLKLKAYSKKRFDPFCRWDRINIPYDLNKYNILREQYCMVSMMQQFR